MLNLRLRKKAEPVKLHQTYVAGPAGGGPVPAAAAPSQTQH